MSSLVQRALTHSAWTGAYRWINESSMFYNLSESVFLFIWQGSCAFFSACVVWRSGGSSDGNDDRNPIYVNILPPQTGVPWQQAILLVQFSAVNWRRSFSRLFGTNILRAYQRNTRTKRKNYNLMDSQERLRPSMICSFKLFFSSSARVHKHMRF